MARLIDRARSLVSGGVKRSRGSHGPSLHRMLNDYRATCLIAAAVRLGVIDLLDHTDQTDRELANALGTNASYLQRLLRGLRAIGLLEHRGDRLCLTEQGRALLRGESGLGDLATLVAEEYLPAWAQIDVAVLTGKPAFNSVFGKDIWQHRSEHPQIDDAFNRLMSRWQRESVSLVEKCLDLSRVQLVIDVGTGKGELLAALLKDKASLKGIAFDQPHILGLTRETLERADVLDRCDVVGGSFFESVPKGGDAYILRHVVHDWDDEHARVLLRRCSEAMSPSSSLLIIDGLMPETSPEPIHLVMRDLHMMAVTGGCERTKGEFTELLKAAGLDLVRVYSGQEGDALQARRASS